MFEWHRLGLGWVGSGDCCEKGGIMPPWNQRFYASYLLLKEASKRYDRLDMRLMDRMYVRCGAARRWGYSTFC
jgi:hypothetical protein